MDMVGDVLENHPRRVLFTAGLIHTLVNAIDLAPRHGSVNGEFYFHKVDFEEAQCLSWK